MEGEGRGGGGGERERIFSMKSALKKRLDTQSHQEPSPTQLEKFTQWEPRK